MISENPRKHEVQFCAEVSKWADRLFAERTALPFGSSDIESFGRGSNKRQDLRFYGRKDRGRGKLALCGEVKLPGTAQGRSPFDVSLMQDAFDKATRENCRYFFTWNVEEIALFDRSRWDAETMHERCIGQWKLGLELNKPVDVTRAEVSLKIQNELLPRFFTDFADIWLERRKDFNEAIPDFYITVLESLLTGPMGPVRELRDYLGVHAEASKSFDSRLRGWLIEQQWNFDRNDPESWRDAIDRAARSMVYVLSNRILFYQAVRLRDRLPELRLPKSANNAEKALKYFRSSFQLAVEATGDYEPVFFPDNDEEWSALTALSGTNSLEAWEKLIRAVDRLNFKEIPTDILGHIFQKLISPEERHKFGQHYTEETIVDVINAFCIRKPEARVIDPACGSGSFLVRAYYRKSQLDKSLENHELLAALYGCDINPFPAHLATLNLASRDLKNEENYPRIVRRNFFTVEAGATFCTLPKATRDHDGNREREDIVLPTLDAVVGNPPYVRYQEIPKERDRGVVRDQTREYLQKVTNRAWVGLEVPGQSDLHVFFWPAAARFLADQGWFGFLTSSSWLDARYGFSLQRWILENFRLVAVIESVDEPWFEDARVKTAVTILQRCKDEEKRASNLVRFVRLNRPLAEILGSRDDEGQKQLAAEQFRDLILQHKDDFSSDQMRVFVKRQSVLWSEGVATAKMFAKQKLLVGPIPESSSEDTSPETEDEQQAIVQEITTTDYAGGKWGRFLRAPEFYFELTKKYGNRFTRIGDIASIRYGILSGCDGFFMPHDVSVELLDKFSTEMQWSTLPLTKRCKRGEVSSGKVVVIKCSDGTLHPIEAKYVRPEVQTEWPRRRPWCGRS
jgi:methylase of polypeptide subunit release factors